MRSEDEIVLLGELMAQARSLSEARIANLAGRDGAFFRRLRNGKSCRLDTAQKMLSFFSDNWPEGAIWPDCIKRPEISGELA
ncbi:MULTISPECIES: hypothetical protein [Acetobacter]|uniref:hypothetical protein n=1 Tax=Acetobacter TaxID=434 RepID=UPI001111F9CB|nr:MULTISPECIES: hypothetical protein [Acetobacter]KAA8426552.1 hypothetical protein FKW54_06915 [Acetobacter pomorum]KAA8436025.1 hypothetical protein FKW50_05775 [Acetobacter pomorum]KAA8454053.1 hypothetical protein FKW52_01855 [Acetobacter pomorum]